MATDAGALRVALSASAASFAADMGKAKNAVRSNAKGMERAMLGVRKSFGAALQATKMLAVAAVAGAGALGYMVRGAIENADKMTKMAQSVGTNVETLTALQHAANLSGVSIETLAKAMKKTAQGASDAAQGIGTAKDAYSSLGISVKDAEGNLKSSDVLMLEVADKFKGMEDGAGKTAIAMGIFGKSGADMIPMLNQGGAGIKAMMEEAKKLGLVIGTDAGQAAERFNDNLTRLHMVQKGFINQMMVGMLPTLEGFAERMIESATESNRMGKAAGVAAAGLKLLFTAGTLLTTILGALGTALGGVAATLVQFFSGEWKQAWATAGTVSDDFAQKLIDAGTNIGKIWDDTGAKALAKAPDVSDKIAAPMIQAAAKIETAAQKAKKTIDELNVRVDNALIFEFDFLPSSKEVQEELKKRSDLQKTAIDNDLAFFFDFIDSKKEKITEMEEFEKQAYRNMESYAGNVFFDVMDGKQTDLLDGFKTMVKRMVAEWMAAQVMMAAFGVGGKGGKGGLIGGLISGVMGLFGGGKAGGGSVSPGRFYEVAERGPELLQMGSKQFLMMGNQTGTVIPSDGPGVSSSNGGRGGDNLNLTMNINAFDSRSVAQSIQAHAAQITGIVQTAYNKRGRSGPLG